jgi:GGDEF domain-containing protein
LFAVCGFVRRLEQEIERSRRFGRVTGSVRDGGEEFVLILPETNLEGGQGRVESSV